MKVGNIYEINYTDYGPYSGVAILIEINPEGFRNMTEDFGEFLCLDGLDDPLGYFTSNDIVREIEDLNIDQAKIKDKNSLIIELYKKLGFVKD